ncbi:MAG TPA: hypothetical protein VF616_29570 [Duganella sp.]|uniref:DUF6630 family protein n=1 Tax=Duganella sp. TaxID=1904440 RepID=UPI002ED38FAE
MLKRLFAFLARQPESDEAQPVEADPQSARQAAAYKEAMAQFVRLICRQLDDEESARLADNVLAQFAGGEADADKETVAEYFYEGVLGDAGQQRGQWLLIQVDWKASDEIDWQVNEILATRGIDDQWVWDSEGKTVMQGLQVLSGWLAKHALSLLSIDFGHDAYYMLIVDDGIAERAIALGRRAGLDVMSFPDFAVTQGEG